MNKYELAVVVNAKIEDDARLATIERVQKYVTRFGGTITNVDEWGKRKLAYEIQKMREGYYYFISFEAEATAPAEIVASNTEVRELVGKVYDALCDDLNTPIALALVFDAVRIINTAKDKKLTLDASDYKALVDLFDNVVFGVLGLRDEESEGGKMTQTMDGLINMVLEQRKAAKAAKDWATCDKIRDDLKALGIQIKDTKDGTEWTLE